MNYKNITVAGSGVLGYQIAFQAAFHNFNVTVYDINEDVLANAKAKFSSMCAAFKRDLHASEADLAVAFDNLAYSSNLKDAVKDADLLIEAVPENPAIKIDFYKNLAEVAVKKTVFATNSSTLLPSQFAEFTGRPSQFLALHFANDIWKNNTAEIMGHSGTNPTIFNDVVAFAKAIGMLALPLQKEQPGYILNSLLVPLLTAATTLLVSEVADPQTIDKTWMKATGAPIGPFAILDIVGINTVYNINKMGSEKSKDPFKIKMTAYIKEHFVDTNKLGVSTGEGFYTYPNPAYKEDDFLS